MDQGRPDVRNAVPVSTPAATRRGFAWWNDERSRALLFQALIIGALIAVLTYLGYNASVNLRQQGISFGFGFLDHEAGFEISPALIPYTPAASYPYAMLVGLLNTLMTAAIGIVFATVIGLVVGLLRLSGNWLTGRLALGYVELMRNTPLVLQLFVWWNVLRISAPGPRAAWQVVPGVFVSNRGVALPVPEYDPGFRWVLAALIVGILAAMGLSYWARRRQERTGQPFPTLVTALALIVLPPV